MIDQTLTKRIGFLLRNGVPVRGWHVVGEETTDRGIWLWRYWMNAVYPPEGRSRIRYVIKFWKTRFQKTVPPVPPPTKSKDWDCVMEAIQ